MNTITISQFLLVIIIGMVTSLPVQQGRTSDEASEADTSATAPKQYILDLYHTTYEHGAPSQETDVWVLADKDIAKENFREKQFVNTNCASYTQYVFQWSDVSDFIQSLNIRRSILRAYIQTINRHFKNDEAVDVTLTVTMVPRNGNETSNTTSDLSNGIFAGQQVITVTRGSDRWMELNITEGTKSILPQMQMQNYIEVQVIIKAQVNCINQKKVPFNLINPAEIPLEQQNRHLESQPFMVIFAHNEKTKEALNQQEEEEEDEVIGEPLNNMNKNAPSKRSPRISCHKSNYVVDLHELGLTNVITPRQINISKCSGECNKRSLFNELTTNHAKIMSSIYHRQRHHGEPITATIPCCVPTKYETIFLLMTTLDDTAIGIVSKNELKATECGCR